MWTTRQEFVRGLLTHCEAVTQEPGLALEFGPPSGECECRLGVEMGYHMGHAHRTWSVDGYCRCGRDLNPPIADARILAARFLAAQAPEDLARAREDDAAFDRLWEGVQAMLLCLGYSYRAATNVADETVGTLA